MNELLCLFLIVLRAVTPKGFHVPENKEVQGIRVQFYAYHLIFRYNCDSDGTAKIKTLEYFHTQKAVDAKVLDPPCQQPDIKVFTKYDDDRNGEERVNRKIPATATPNFDGGP